MGIIKNDIVAQSAQEPSKRVGTGQSPQVKQVEGSLLGSPKKAGVRTGRTPSL